MTVDDRPRDEMTMTAPRWVFQILVGSAETVSKKAESEPLREECIKAAAIAQDRLGPDFEGPDDTQSESDDITVKAGEWYRLKSHGDVYVSALSRSIEGATHDGVVEEDIVVNFRPENAQKESPRLMEIGKFIDEAMK